MSCPRGVESERVDLLIHLAEIYGPGDSLRNSKTAVGGASGLRFRPLQQSSRYRIRYGDFGPMHRGHQGALPIASTDSSCAKAAKCFLGFMSQHVQFAACTGQAIDGFARSTRKPTPSKRCLLAHCYLFLLRCTTKCDRSNILSKTRSGLYASKNSAAQRVEA